MKPSACSMIKKNTNTGIRFWISALNYTLLGANGPLSLNLSVLINKMGRKANVQGYCNDHKCVRGEAEWRVSASWHSFSLGRWIKFWRWRVAMLHNKVNALKVMELNAPKWLKWYISFCIFYHNFLKRYVKILAQCLALSRCSGNASLIPLIKFFNLKKWQYRKSNKITTSVNVLEEVINFILISNFLWRLCFTSPLTAVMPWMGVRSTPTFPPIPVKVLQMLLGNNFSLVFPFT